MVYNNYRIKKCNAIKNDCEFHLSESEYLDLMNQPCHYCGKPSNFGIKGIKRKDQASIDRINNDLRSYTVDNCVSACMRCNSKKRFLSYEDFISLIQQYGSVEAIPECYVEGGFNQYMREYKSTPEYKAYMREYMRERQSTPEAKAYMREYQSTPEYKAKQRERQSTPEAKAKRREYQSTPEAKAYMREYQSSPEYKAYMREYMREYQRAKRAKARINTAE